MLRRVAIWVARLTGALFGLLLALGLGVALLLASDFGRGRIVTVVADLSAAAGVPVTIAGLGGALPFAPTIARLTVGDADGVWLEAEGLSLAVGVRALLDRRVVIDHLDAARVAVLRPPHSPAAAPDDGADTADAGPPAIPELPVAVSLTRFRIGEFTVDRELAGVEVAGSVNADAALSREGRGNADIGVALVRPLALETRLTLDAAADLDTEQTLTVTTDLAGIRRVLAKLEPSLEARLAALPDGPVTLTATASLDMSEGDVAVSAVSLDVGPKVAPIAVSGRARLIRWGATAEATLTVASPDVAPWLAVAGPMAEGLPKGPLNLTVEFAGSPETGDVKTGKLDIDLGPDAARISLRADARATAWGATIDAGLKLAVTDVKPWVEAAVAATGPLPEGLPLDGPLDLSLDARRGMTEAVSGRLDASLSPARHPRLRVAGDYRFDPDATAGPLASVVGLELRVGDDRVSGGLAARLGGTPSADGKLTFDLPRLGALAALVGRTDIDGAVKGEISLVADQRGQGASVKLTAKGLSLPGTALAGATIDASASDILGVPTLSAKVVASGLTAGDFAVGAVNAVAQGRPTALNFSLDAREVGPEKAGLSLKGDLKRDDAAPAPGLTVRLAETTLTARGQRVRLAAPATVTVAGARIAVDQLRLDGAGARLSVAGGMDGEALDAKWRLERFPLTLLGLIDPSLNGSGEVVGSGSVSGTTGAPVATAEADLKGVSLPQMAAAGLKPIDGKLNGRWNGATGDASGGLEARSRDGLVIVSAKGGMRGNGALDAAVKGSVDLRVLDVILAANGDRARGVPRFDVAIGGTAMAPSIKGAVTMEGGGYDNVASGMSLSGITLKVTGAGDKARIDRFTATTNGGGTVSVSGDIALNDGTKTGGPRFDLKLKAEKAMLADTALATVVADAALTMVGKPDDARVAGTVVLPRVDIHIPRKLPPSVTALDVVEVGGRRPAAKEPEEPPAAKPVGAGEATAGVALDVKVSAPRRVLVTGQGFHGEFGGDIHVGGTAAVPDVTGRFAMSRGTLDVLGRRVTFSKGELVFDGGPVIDPRLDVSATLGDAEIDVTGSPRRPEISFTSATGLPQNEVVSNMLFGKSSDKLSAGEAIELASALADLAGLGGDRSLLGSLKSRLGLDQLDVGSGTDGATELRAGSFLGDGVFVGIDQSAAGIPRGRVEVDLTDHLKAQAGVGPDGEPEVGIGFELDY